MRLRRGAGQPGRGQGRWHVRVIRGLWPDRNPLRRAADRAQVYLLAVMFVVAAAGAPFAALVASHAAYAAALRAEQAQQAGTHEVRATLTEAAGSTDSAGVVSPLVPAEASWTSVTGVARTGEVLAPPGTPRGGAVTVWTDAAGQLSSPPLQPSQVAGQGELAAAGAITGIALLYLGAAVIVRHVLYRRRMSAWEADWVVTARAWNRQRW